MTLARPDMALRMTMQKRRRCALFFMFWIMAVCSVYAGENVPDKKLETGISIYRNGEYQKAIDSLTACLPTMMSLDDSLVTLKYLGFSYGMMGRIDDAKLCFKAMLEKRPDMEIDSLECPPNIALIFTQTKLEQRLAATDTMHRVNREIVEQKRNIVLPVLLLSTAVLSAGAGGYYYFSGNDLHDKYRALVTTDQSQLDRYYRNYTNAYVKSAVCFGVSGTFLPVAVYLFLRKSPVAGRLNFENSRGITTLVYSF
jgi:hypothetical protein